MSEKFISLSTKKPCNTTETSSPKINADFPTVLLIEDNIYIQKINTAFLELLGCKVILAQNGSQAIARLAEHFDLILLDIGLPDISGLDVGKKIRHTPRGRHIPIIAITAYGEEISNDCLAVGINEVIIKPVPIERFESILMRWIPKQQMVNQD